jgi:mono/diheme cytochrome c family protein
MDEFWAIGFRNPYRISFDPLTGALWVGDVGSTEWEEVNLVEKGKHYQFPHREGYEPTKFKAPEKKLAEEVPPRYAYVHTAYDRAVIGGFVYRGDLLPELYGQYLFADNYSSKVFTMSIEEATNAPVEHIATANQYAQRGVSSISQLANGDILLTTLGRSSAPTGEVLKLVLADPDKAERVLPPPVEEEAYSAAELKSLYDSNCGRCHALDGSGDSPDAHALGVPLPDFRSASFHESRTDENLLKLIRDGGQPHGMSALMPPWGAVLTKGELEGLVEVVRDFQQSTPK